MLQSHGDLDSLPCHDGYIGGLCKNLLWLFVDGGYWGFLGGGREAETGHGSRV